jgi:hypothetical protein
MTFEEDLTKRRIDVAAFAAGDPQRYAEWRGMYAQMHPNSFYGALKMVINDVRRRFWLAEALKPAAAEAPAKPAVRRAAIPETSCGKCRGAHPAGARITGARTTGTKSTGFHPARLRNTGSTG